MLALASSKTYKEHIYLIIYMEEDTLYNILIVACIIGIIVVTVLIFTNKTTEPFTELYFENHQLLPKEIELGKEYSFMFTVHNMEGEATNYFYEFSKETDNNKKVIDFKQFSLAKDRSTTFRKTFKIDQDFKDAKITIKLLNKDQEIHFWVKQK